ncbi:MAG: glucose-6-phosphate isomerase, partial [Desulfobacterales bacterium]
MFGRLNLNSIPAWKSLKQHAENFSRPDRHLKYLIKENSRLEKFSLKCNGLFYDFSRQRVDEKAMSLLFELAEARKLKEQFISMMNGEKINISENRAALHAASRNFSGNSIFIDEKDVMPEIIK